MIANNNNDNKLYRSRGLSRLVTNTSFWTGVSGTLSLINFYDNIFNMKSNKQQLFFVGF